MSSIAAHDNAVDDQKHAQREKELDPARSIEDERGNCPYDEEPNACNDADVHVPRR